MRIAPAVVTAFLCLAFWVQSSLAANAPAADRAWQTILEQAAGPGTRFRSQEDALNAARQHLDKQEAALRDFERGYPDDSRHYSAMIRLATILAAQARLRHEPPVMDAARKILSGLENDPATPAPVKADAAFARISQEMQDANGHDDTETRADLLQSIRRFDASFPGDRRTGNVLREVSTLYDDDLASKKGLLEEASSRVTDPESRDRIGDDLRRISFVGQALDMRLRPVEGGPTLDLAQRHGRVEVILFWASFSLPALRELAALKEMAGQFSGQPVDFVTVALDEERPAVVGMLKTAEVRWPTHYDGKGWKGELVRGFGINALPTVWVLDRQGRLLSLNARGDEAATIRRALGPP